MPRNIEIKARIKSAPALRPKVAAIADHGPTELFQDDTFFSCPRGRLKLRAFSQTSGELIFYRRPNDPGPKESFYLIGPVSSPDQLREVLTFAYGQVGRVFKRRTLFLAGRTRIHLDRVNGLGDFLELEVVLRDDEPTEAGVKLANELLQKLEIGPEQLVEGAYVDLLANSSAGFIKEFGQALQSYASSSTAGNAEQAEAAAIQALSLAGEQALRNPTPELELGREADVLESKGDWAGAEATRRKILVLEESSGQAVAVAKAQMDLSRLLRLVGRWSEAQQHAQAATACARQTGLFPVLMMALENEAHSALGRGDSAQALARASEAVQIVEPDKAFDSIRARALTVRARCLMAEGDDARARQDLSASWDLLQRAAKIGPGAIAMLATWWQTHGELEARNGDLAAAEKAMNEALNHLRSIEKPYASAAIARVLEKLSEILKRRGKIAEAEAALKEACSIRASLHLPTDA